MPSWKVKVTNFDTAQRLDPSFKGCVGLYKLDSRTIYIDESLPRFSQGTMRSVLEHEIVHAKMHRAGLEVDRDTEEALATLVSVMACPDKYQSNEERALKIMMGRGLKWSRKADRGKLIRRACRYVGLVPVPKLIKALQ